MKIEDISKAFTNENPVIDIVGEIFNNTIYGEVGIYGDSYECVITLINEREIFIGFSEFIVMNEIQNMIPVLQKLYFGTLEVEYCQYVRNSRFGIFLKQY